MSIMSKSGAIFRYLLVTLLTGAYGLGLPAHADSLKDQLVGTWKLVSSTRYVGDATQPGFFGTNSMGILMYTADGYMCGNLMNLDRPKFTSPDIRSGTVAEKTAAFDTFFAYCSRFEVNDAERFVVHKVESSLFPNWTGSVQKRFADLNGNRLTLRTPPLLVEGKEVVLVLVWERAQ
jgi:lipocalin-like protein